MQESMLFQHLKEPHSRLYFEQTCYRLTGAVEVGKLIDAWNAVAEANEMLRTVFRWQGLKKPVQVILKNPALTFKEIDLSQLSPGAGQQQLDKIKQEDRQNRLDLCSRPFRVIFCKMAENRYEMIVSNHHIIYDGWSNAIILRELAEAYHRLYLGKEWLKPVKTRYKEYLKWQQQQDKIKQTLYWKNFFKWFYRQDLFFC